MIYSGYILEGIIGEMHEVKKIMLKMKNENKELLLFCVFDEQLNNELNCLECLQLFCLNNSVYISDDTLMGLLELANMDKLWNEKVMNLSIGMKRRLILLQIFCVCKKDVFITGLYENVIGKEIEELDKMILELSTRSNILLGFYSKPATMLCSHIIELNVRKK